ncbi:M20/M25/M40 family metallo-hydrolase [Desmospora profundinema]|uniref:Arginine utilization protein RocB n=1 Tax=Desmospora profundinema TaxID=1571184 RepID=A0ABU1IJL7_9BACL|nr:M20/M25/M40 family metallo-hydrolase [Desmospora profundinema]MDR6224953.1 arginine utilization protein RocB [Desmospora profundinema]
MNQWNKEVLEWTRALVSHPSVVGTLGERDLAHYIHGRLREWPYFQMHPDHLWLVRTRGDEKERYSVLALVKGNLCPNRETVLLMGHLDTVGVEDYGKWKRWAFTPDELMKRWKDERIPPGVKRDLEEGEWACGRGSVDMKSGLACHLALLRHYADRVEEWSGNLVFLAACDEEDNSKGILSSLDELAHIRREHDLDYIAAINTDYTSPRYDGDPHRYVYLGTVGKLLPAFYIVGSETHAGQAFEGLDPNLVAAELTRRLDYNPEFCDEMYGEVTTPPVSLKQTDLKGSYDVQTPVTAWVYYNYFVHRRSPKDVLESLREVAAQALEAALAIHRERLDSFARKSGDPVGSPDFSARVYTYEELVQQASKEQGPGFEEEMRQFAMNLVNEEGLDLREYNRRMVEELWQCSGEAGPGVVLFYASVYFPRVVLDPDQDRDRRLIEAVREAVGAVQPDCIHPIQVRHFFPYISDMSFVAISDDEEGLDALAQNMPAWGTKHRMDVDAIRELDIPVVNIGPYGKDAHKQWERVEVAYSMELVPEINRQVVERLFRPS